MEKFLKTILFFAAISVLVYVILLAFAGTWLPLYLRKNLHYRESEYGHMYSRMKDAESRGKIDILFLGSSHAYRGFDPRIFEKHGYSTFNLGSSGQTPVQSLMLLEKYLVKLQPELVVLEVYPEVMGMDGVESSLDVLANSSTDCYSLKMALTVNHVKTYNSLLFSFVEDYVVGNRNYSQPEKNEKDFYIKGTGYVARDMEYFKNVSHQPSTWNFNQKQTRAFDKILKMLNRENIKFILVQAPVTRKLYLSKTNNDFTNSLFHTKGNFVNFNLQLPLDDSLHFYDADHLNQKGVEIFNEAFIEWMKPKFFSPTGTSLL